MDIDDLIQNLLSLPNSERDKFEPSNGMEIIALNITKAALHGEDSIKISQYILDRIGGKATTKKSSSDSSSELLELLKGLGAS